MSLTIRLPLPHENGVPLIDWLAKDRAGEPRDRRYIERMALFVQQWDHLRSERLQGADPREPVVRDYHERWGTPVATIYRLLDEFRDIFGPTAEPSSLLELLWQGIPTESRRQWLLAVRIVEVPPMTPESERG